MLNTQEAIAEKRKCLYAVAEGLLALKQSRKGSSYSLQFNFRVEESTISKFLPDVCKEIIEEYKKKVLCCSRN